MGAASYFYPKDVCLLKDVHFIKIGLDIGISITIPYPPSNKEKKITWQILAITAVFATQNDLGFKNFGHNVQVTTQKLYFDGVCPCSK